VLLRAAREVEHRAHGPVAVGLLPHFEDRDAGQAFRIARDDLLHDGSGQGPLMARVVKVRRQQCLDGAEVVVSQSLLEDPEARLHLPRPGVVRRGRHRHEGEGRQEEQGSQRSRHGFLLRVGPHTGPTLHKVAPSPVPVAPA